MEVMVRQRMRLMKQITLFVLCSTWAFSNIALPENFTADFRQLITNTKKKVITYKGTVRFSDKKLFKWSYLEPTQKEVCTDGHELLVVDHDLEQVSAFIISKGLDVAKVLNKAKHYSKNIYLADFDGRKYTIQLNAKKQLQSIAYFDDLDNKVQLVFTEIHYGKGKLKAQEMQCNYPESYDQIRG